MVSTSLFVLCLASLALAAPSKRQSDSGSCRALETQCAASIKSDLSDVWNHKACIFGATCFGGQRPVDGFLAAVYADRGLSGTAPKSVNLPRVTTSVFNSISTDGIFVSQQNFIDGYYSSLDATGGPYPTESQYVISAFRNLQDWTAYCGVAIPFQNFADYFQYSSSVDSSNCGTVSTITSHMPQSTDITTDITSIPPTTTVPVVTPTTITSFFPQSTDLTTDVASPAPTTTSIVVVTASAV